MSVEHEGRLLSAIANMSLSDFVHDAFGCLPRADQRRWAHAYLHGLLTLPGKKTLQRLAAAASTPPVAPHGLHQFINSSPWDWNPPRRALSRIIAERGRVRAWTVGMSIIPKRGEHSVGVHRRFITETGRTVNCQAALGLFLSTEQRCFPVDWSMLLGPSWLDDERRRRVRIPEMVRPWTDWEHLVNFADFIAATGPSVRAPLVAELVNVPDVGPLVAGLAQRGIDFVLEVGPGQPVSLVDGAVPFRRWSVPQVTTAKQFLTTEKPGQRHVVGGGDQRGPSIIHCATVHLPRGTMSARWPHQGYRLLAEWSQAGKGPVRHWITNMFDAGVDKILALAAHAVRVRSMVKEMEGGFGLLDFEGRSFPGWHHHMTMVSAAYAYRGLFPTGLSGVLADQRAQELLTGAELTGAR